ncbi:hypothetical protein BU16DRAFT_461789 [Lophium mytilinum]|uniref:Transcription initiation factor TFIID subunit 12 domain-containing protein n=1 Tax=Lophium mytilinum TaxID=390894 RepID=A0A6A6QTY7_9PEZI|nr:hypothetical protein BU16DRAFT_461789 [Lophium mytilinum]
MSNPGQQSQGAPGAPQQNPQLLKPEDVLKLTCLNDEQKTKYRPAVASLWAMIQGKPKDSPERISAHNKLAEWSQKLIGQERLQRQKAQAAQAANRPQSQPSQPGQQPPQGQTMNQPRPQIQNAPSQPMQGGQQQQQVNPSILKHVQDFPYHMPPGGPLLGTPEGDAKLKEYKNSYLIMLTKQEKAKSASAQIMRIMEERRNAGQDVPPELIQRKAATEQEYNAGKLYVDDFRKKQGLWKQQAEQQRLQQTQQQQQQQQQSHNQQGFPQVKSEVPIKTEGGNTAPGGQQFTNMQMGGQPGTQQPNSQGPAHNLNAARNSMSSAPQQPGQAPFTPQSSQGQNPSGQINQQHNNLNAQRPQISPAQANAHAQQQQQNSPHPQSATGNNPTGPPVPLSHRDAVGLAQRSYSQGEANRNSAPQQMPTSAGGYHSIPNRDQMNNTKMPIPKTLNVAQPTPVSMGPARPTLGGPGNGAPGMMGQPVMQKVPTFQLEGEGDRVLSKRKLDELVRQVTGGGEGPGGESLTPEVEEAMLQLADDFVDTVISSACKLSKLRESPQLDIRDLQLILERNYNIRIPGYASDEIRTVKKLHPAQGWTAKMNAVQAAKVMGGKTDI